MILNCFADRSGHLLHEDGELSLNDQLDAVASFVPGGSPVLDGERRGACSDVDSQTAYLSKNI